MICEHYPVKPATLEWAKQRKTLSIDKRQLQADNRAKSICETADIEWQKSDVNALNKDGYQEIQPILSEDKISEMYEYFSNKQMSDFYGQHEVFSLENRPDSVKMARTDTKTNILCPYMIDLMTSDKLISIASEYLSAPATLNCIFPLWSFKESQPSPINMQLFHRDADDYKFVKLFILLTDTEDGNGEQVYVRGSHSRKDLPSEMYQIRRYSNEEVQKYFSEQEITKIYGTAGKCWLANTHGIHRGTVPTKTNRLLLQLQYTLDPTPIFNYKQYRYSRWDELSDLVKYSTRMYLRS